MPLQENVCVKVEPEWGDVRSEALARLYEGHEIKEELVLGPDVLQPPDVAYTAFVVDELPEDICKPEPERVETCTENHSRNEPAVKQCVVVLERLTHNLTKILEENGNKTVDQHQTETSCKPSQEYSGCSLRLRDCVVKLNRLTFDNLKQSNKHNRTNHSLIHVKDTEPFKIKQEICKDIKSKNNYICNTCNKVYKSNDSLYNHMRIVHTGEKPFECEVCEKRFPVKKYLTRHRFTHEKRRFKCKKCNKKFSSKVCLVQHLRIHDENKFTCDVCFKSFVWKHGLESHKLLHTGQKPFTCELCKKQFRLKVSLVLHIQLCAK